MTESPTTENGPLHTEEATLDDRLIRATYKTAEEAQSARALLVQNGVAEDRVTVINDAGGSADVQAALQPKDQGILARIRDTIVPDDSSAATINAAKQHEALLELRPTKEEVEMAVKIIEGSNPSRFDAALERWRNAG